MKSIVLLIFITAFTHVITAQQPGEIDLSFTNGWYASGSIFDIKFQVYGMM